MLQSVAAELARKRVRLLDSQTPMTAELVMRMTARRALSTVLRGRDRVWEASLKAEAPEVVFSRLVIVCLLNV